jgi:hypothetical protein
MELASAWFHLRRQIHMGGSPRLPYVWDKAQGFYRRLRDMRGAHQLIAPPGTLPDGPGAAADPVRVLHRIVAGSYRHAVKPYEGRVLFCTPMDRPPGRDWTFGPIWRQVVRGPFEELLLPGDHLTMFQDPAIQQVADRLNVPYPSASNE